MKVPELPALTGIRFLAATFVFLSHIIIWPGICSSCSNFNFGNFGVAVFFVLSGFILTYNYAWLFANGVSFGDYGRFIWDRLAKIYPLYLLTLLLAIPIELLGHHRTWSWSALIMQLTLLQCILPFDQLRSTDHFNVPGWSISCEFFFYLLAPFLIWRSLSVKRPIIAIVTTVVATTVLAMATGIWAVHISTWPGRFALARTPEFLMGVATAGYYLKGGVPTRSYITLAIAGGIALLSLSLWGCEQAPLFLRLGFLNAPGAALLIYGLAYGQGWIARFLSQHWIRLFGMSSFAFYLIHDLFIRTCKGIFEYCHVSVSEFWIKATISLMLFLCIQMTSIYLFKKFETPIQKFLRGLTKNK
jgi:peptidoglycan/LPS O-acetylase OafA/YrhL